MGRKPDDNGLANLCSTLLCGDLFINQRSKAPTFCGWILLILLAFGLMNFYFRRPANSPSAVRPDIARFGGGKGNIAGNPAVGPKVANVIMPKEDAQEAEFKAIEAENKKADGPPRLPVFDPNLHENKAHRKAEAREKTQFGMPRPKEPVKTNLEPRLQCDDNQITLLVLIHTRPDHTGERSAIRRSWGEQKNTYNFDSQKWFIVFLMGNAGTTFDDKVNQEHIEFGDILRGDFDDSPFEDTRKLIMAMKWVERGVERCRPKLILKSQDNIFLNMAAIIPWLEIRYLYQSNVYVGRLHRNEKPVRDATDAHYVSPRDFNRDVYPDMIQAPVYLFSEDVFGKLISSMTYVTPIAVEDAYVAILAEKANVAPKHNDHFQMVTKPSNICHYLHLFFIYNILAHEHVELMNKVRQAASHSECQNMEVMDRNKGLKKGNVRAGRPWDL